MVFVEQHRVGLGPVVEEGRPQAIHARTFDAEVGVAPLVGIPRVALPQVRDPDAAGEADGLVDDEHLAVRAMVDLAEPEAPERAEPAHLNPGILHVVDQAPLDRPRAPGVEEDRTRTPAERAASLREPRSDLALPVDEGEEVDGVLGRLDRLEHRGEDLVTVAEDVDAIALGRGHADDPLERAARALHRVVWRGARRGHHRRGGHAAAVAGRGSAAGSDSATFCDPAAWARRAHRFELSSHRGPEEKGHRGKKTPQEQGDHAGQRSVGMTE